MSGIWTFIFWVFATALAAQSGDGQAFRWEAPVDPAPADGYYRILLQPNVTSQLKTDFSDVRIYDKDSVQTPYVVYADEAVQGLDRFVTYQIVDKHLVRGCCSHITVCNTMGNAIDHILLEVNNADASREMTLSGSYDGGSWYSVRDHFTVSSFDTYEKGERKTTSIIRFDFPKTDYKYYRFDFDDYHWWWDDERYPIFVVRAGYTEPTFIPEQCLALPRPAVAQVDSMKQKETIVQIVFPDSQYVDHLHIYVHAKKNKDFYRAAVLYEVVEAKDEWVTLRREQQISSTILSSMNANEIDLPTKQVKHLVLRIRNEDNQPLVIDSVVTFQVKHYLVAELEKDNHYVLRFGNHAIPAPDYDLKYFKEKIPAAPPVIVSGSRKDISAMMILPNTKVKASEKSKVAQANDSVFKDKRVIWAAIGAVILLLGFMTMKMLKEMKKEEEKN